MKNLGAVFAIQMMLLGCASIPHGGDIKSIISDYDAKIEFAQSSIEYGKCLDTISLPNTTSNDPENLALQIQIPQLANLILREYTVEELSDDAKRSGCPQDGAHSFFCPKVIVTYPSFETFIEESRALQASLKRRLMRGESTLSADDQEAVIIDNHRVSGGYGDPFSSKMREYRVYSLTSISGGISVSKHATRISKLALQASYFSDALDYQSIYECSKISGAYDKRFNGTDGLTFEQAQASVDFSAMTEDERRISTSDKLEEIYNRYDDVKDTIKTLEKLF